MHCMSAMQTNICMRMQVVTLDMGLLVAGTKYRGEFEERLKKLMDEIKQNDDIILVRFAWERAYSGALPAFCFLLLSRCATQLAIHSANK